MNDQPALLGNEPIFKSGVRVAKPLLPGFEELKEQVRDMLESGVVTKGHHLRDFEEAVAEHLGVKHAVAVSSCTAGLMLTYKALGLGDESVVPSFTFMATASALVWAGLRPVFADINPETTNLDPSTVEAAITDKTTAIVAVHNSGNPADADALARIAERRGLRLIFDAAHGFGSLYRGTPLGREGDASVFSLSPTKLLVAGEGGIVATDDDDVAEKVRVGREYGNGGDYDSVFAGINARLPEFNALLGRRGLSVLEEAARRRNLTAEIYRERLGRLPGLTFQRVLAGNRSSYKDFSIVVDPHAFGLSRDRLALALAAENIETRKYYDPPVHRQSAYRRYAPPGRDLVNTDLTAARILCLPIWSNMDAETVADICLAVERAHGFAPEINTRLNSEEMSAAYPSQASE